VRGIQLENLADVFSYHAPGGNDLANYQALRDAARAFAEVILTDSPPCADQQAALRKVREAVMTANAAVALKGSV
jgi:hypothetical protein